MTCRRLPPASAFASCWSVPASCRFPAPIAGLAALQAKAAQFEALYLSGAAMSASMGLPDLGILTIEDVCFFVRQVARASQLPVLVDGDTGFGEALNVMNMVRAFEDAGAAAVQIEDQILPKKCGHLNDKKLIAPQDMAAKIAAAAQGAPASLYRGPHRCRRRRRPRQPRSPAPNSMSRPAPTRSSRKRCMTPRRSASFPQTIKVPLLANMTEFGRTPFMTASEFEALGYKMVIWPVSALRMAAKAQADLYEGIRNDGGTHRLIDRMQTRAELYATIGYHEYEALDSSIITSVTPEGMPQRAPAASRPQ